MPLPAYGNTDTTPHSGIKKKLLLALKIFASVFFVAVILLGVDLHQLGNIIMQARWPLLIVAMAVSLLAKLVGATAWMITLAHLQMPVSLFNAFRIRMGASFVAAFFPSQVGLLSRAVFLKALNKNYSIPKGISTIFLERLMSSILMAAASGLGWVYCMTHRLSDPKLLGFLGLIFVVNLAVILMILLSVYQADRLIGFTRKLLEWAREKGLSLVAARLTTVIVEKVEKVATALGHLVKTGRLMRLFFVLTLLSFSLGFSATAYFIMWSLNIQLPVLVILFLPLSLTALRILPISFQGVGLTEGVGIVVFAALGVARPEAAAFMFLYQIITNYMFRVIGGFFIPGLGGNVFSRIQTLRKISASETI